jgi:hypothetical protein
MTALYLSVRRFSLCKCSLRGVLTSTNARCATLEYHTVRKFVRLRSWGCANKGINAHDQPGYVMYVSATYPAFACCDHVYTAVRFSASMTDEVSNLDARFRRNWMRSYIEVSAIIGQLAGSTWTYKLQQLCVYDIYSSKVHHWPCFQALSPTLWKTG